MAITAGKTSIPLPTEMVALVRGAVEAGEYASSSEVVRDARRDWTRKHILQRQGVAELRELWQAAMNDKTPVVSADEGFERLERKYQAIAAPKTK